MSPHAVSPVADTHNFPATASPHHYPWRHPWRQGADLPQAHIESATQLQLQAVRLLPRQWYIARNPLQQRAKHALPHSHGASPAAMRRRMYPVSAEYGHAHVRCVCYLVAASVFAPSFLPIAFVCANLRSRATPDSNAKRTSSTITASSG